MTWIKYDNYKLCLNLFWNGTDPNFIGFKQKFHILLMDNLKSFQS